MATKEELQTDLAMLESAKRKLLAGESIVEITDETGASVKYSGARLPAIIAEIKSIKKQLGMTVGTALTLG